MGKVFAILMIVVGIWVGLEVMNHGTQGAFGGLAVKMGVVEASPTAASQPLPQRKAEKVDRAFQESANRVDRQLDQVQ